MFCQICHAMRHVTNDCLELEKNSLSRPSKRRSKHNKEFKEMNVEAGAAMVSEGGGKGNYRNKKKVPRIRLL